MYIESTTGSFFDERKAVDAAGYLLHRAGGEMYYIHLLKLLYLADREALVSFQRPITFDRFVFMKNGPVLSNVYRIINEDYERSPIWSSHITDSEGYRIGLKQPIDVDDVSLSDAELAVLDRVFDQYGSWDRFELCEFTHTLPEWIDPQGSMIPFSYRHLLERSGAGADDLARVEDVLALKSERVRLSPDRSDRT
jgi:uncharacterized phage-associated protein